MFLSDQTGYIDANNIYVDMPVSVKLQFNIGTGGTLKDRQTYKNNDKTIVDETTVGRHYRDPAQLPECFIQKDGNGNAI